MIEGVLFGFLCTLIPGAIIMIMHRLTVEEDVKSDKQAHKEQLEKPIL